MANNLDEMFNEGTSIVPVEEKPESSVPAEVTKEDSNDTPKEGEEMLSMEDFDNRLGIGKKNSVEEKSKVPPTDNNLNPQDVKPAEVKKDIPKPDIKTEVKPQQPINKPLNQAKTDARDYSGFNEQEVNALKRMSNEAFNFVAPKIKDYNNVVKDRDEVKQSYETLKKSSEDFKYFDEHGYIKDEKFLEAKQIEDQGGKELTYWQDQLIKVESGEQWADINGKVYDASPQAKVAIYNQINKLNNIVTSNTNKADAIKANWDNKHSNYKKFWSDLEDRHFANYKGKENDNKWIKGMDNTLVEGGMAGNPLRGIVNKLFATTMELREAYTKLLNEKSVNSQANKVAIQAGPSSSSIVNGVVSKDKGDMLDMQEFEDYKRQRKIY